MTKQNSLSRRERQIMDIVYARGRVAAVEVWEALSDRPSQTAVRTLLRILEEKGHLRHTKRGRQFVYLPTRPRRRAGQSAMQRVLSTFFDGSLEKAVAAHLAQPNCELPAEELERLAVLIDEARKRNVIVHRVIAAVGGSTYCDFEELKAMAQIAREEKIEVVMTVGHRKGWDVGAKEISTPEGAMQAFRLRGSDNISYHIADIMRNIEAGHRGFLVYDEGVLFLLNKVSSFF